MSRWLALLTLLVFCPLPLSAQETPLLIESADPAQMTDVYGQIIWAAEGRLTNTAADQAFPGVALEAQALDAAGETIGFGEGYLVDACGAALPFDVLAEPGRSYRFAVPLELDDLDAQVASVAVQVFAEEGVPFTPPAAAAVEGITPVAGGEIVRLEWIDDGALRYAEGCDRDLFFELAWREYDLTSETDAAIEHPRAGIVTDALRRQLGLTEELYFRHSFLSPAPDARRIFYQTEINTAFTSEPDGSFKRQLFERLAHTDRTLQGITWLDEGRFLAYYYGAFGDPVSYWTATVDGQTLSEPAKNTIPSLITPGASPDGQIIIIAAEVDGQTGYYSKRAAFPTTELLFQAPAPGNNWPGPLYDSRDGADVIYAALPLEAGPTLACYDTGSDSLRELLPLPLQLLSEERAWWRLSPDGATIALAANGLHGGLWLIDVAGRCGA